jgi:hypothetical protein
LAAAADRHLLPRAPTPEGFVLWILKAKQLESRVVELCPQ